MDKEEYEKNIEIFGGIYGYMFGYPYIPYGGKYYGKDDIIFIKSEKLTLGRNNDCLIYVWGWPGPDFNEYYFSDYKKTWAFRESDIEKPKIPQGRCPCRKCEYAPESWGEFSICLPEKCPRSQEILRTGRFETNFDGYCSVGVMSENGKKGILWPIHEPKDEDMYDIKITKQTVPVKQQYHQDLVVDSIVFDSITEV